MSNHFQHSFNAGNSNETLHIGFWYVKHKTKIKLLVKKLNTFIADIEKKLLRDILILCLSELTLQP